MSDKRKKVVIKLERLYVGKEQSQGCQKQKQNKQSKKLSKKQEMGSYIDKQLILETVKQSMWKPTEHKKKNQIIFNLYI